MHQLPVSDVSFEIVLNLFKRLYDLIWTTGYLLWQFLVTPVDEEVAELVPQLAGSTNLELLFGAGLITALLMSLVKRFIPS